MKQKSAFVSVFLRIFAYFSVLLRIFAYFGVFCRILVYFSVFSCIFVYFRVLSCITHGSDGEFVRVSPALCFCAYFVCLARWVVSPKRLSAANPPPKKGIGVSL